MEWNKALRLTGKPTPSIGDVLKVAFEKAGAIVVLLTPDEEARLKAKFRVSGDAAAEFRLRGQARPNVLFEAGMAFGSRWDNTVLVEVGALRPAGDLAGKHVVRMNGTAEARRELATELEAAGCEVDTCGVDWLSAGEFGT